MLVSVHGLEHVDEGEEGPTEWYSLAQLEIACNATAQLVSTSKSAPWMHAKGMTFAPWLDSRAFAVRGISMVCSNEVTHCCR